MHKLYIAMGLIIISSFSSGMDLSEYKQVKKINAHKQEIMILNFLNEKVEKEIEAAQQEHMINRFLTIKAEKEKEKLFKNQNYYVFCIII